MEPLVSVIVPTFNRGEIVCRTIDNLFEQTYRNFEIIIVDDGSTDDTQSRLRQFDGRIRIITQENSGPAVARNRGAAAAHGEIIAFQDSDDLWNPTKLARQVVLLEMDKAIPCCLCNVLLKVIDGKEFTSFDLSLVHPRHEEGVWLNVSEVLASRFLLFNQAVAIRRKVFEKVGGFDETLKYLEDYDLPLRLSFEGPWALIRDPLVMYGKDSPLSFSQAALRDPIVLKQCELQICNRMLTIARGGNEQVRFRRQLHRRMRIFHRELKAIELGRKRFWGAQIISRLLMRGEHYVRVGFRRSPWFPKVVTVPLGKRRYVTDKS